MAAGLGVSRRLWAGPSGEGRSGPRPEPGGACDSGRVSLCCSSAAPGPHLSPFAPETGSVLGPGAPAPATSSGLLGSSPLSAVTRPPPPTPAPTLPAQNILKISRLPRLKDTGQGDRPARPSPDLTACLFRKRLPDGSAPQAPGPLAAGMSHLSGSSGSLPTPHAAAASLSPLPAGVSNWTCPCASEPGPTLDSKLHIGSCFSQLPGWRPGPTPFADAPVQGCAVFRGRLCKGAPPWLCAVPRETGAWADRTPAPLLGAGGRGWPPCPGRLHSELSRAPCAARPAAPHAVGWAGGRCGRETHACAMRPPPGAGSRLWHDLAPWV